ncbi:MAG: hypothetical protein IPI32_15705 [Austwickia sp.]|nr:hypothetical protein [Austwickia sp.]MBK8435627.1 hypothetical protein [Austwickia sp.]MBK9100803.1 hypothetical protein [Austwickia sp.]
MITLIALAALVGRLGGATDPPPITTGTKFQTRVDADGIDVHAMRRHASRAPSAGKSGRPQVQRIERRYVVTCPGNTITNGDAFTCPAAVAGCRHHGPNAGPLAIIWQRTLTPNPGPWTRHGATCFPRVNPHPPAAPTHAMISAAWSRTPFTKPTLIIQPPGGRTLIRVPTYLQAVFPEPGYGPGDIHTVTLLGHRVQIRPRLATYRYHFGDGTPPLTTTSPGGPYPDGDITHTYPTPGTVTLSIDADYTGDYAIDGGPWQPIGDTITITGTRHRLDILTAHTRLVPP